MHLQEVRMPGIAGRVIQSLGHRIGVHTGAYTLMCDTCQVLARKRAGHSWREWARELEGRS